MVNRCLDGRLWPVSGSHALGALEEPRLAPRPAKSKTPAMVAGVNRPNQGTSELTAMRGVPGNARNIGAADADVGKLAVAQARQFVQALVIALPLLDEADECGKHGVLLSS